MVVVGGGGGGGGGGISLLPPTFGQTITSYIAGKKFGTLLSFHLKVR